AWVPAWVRASAAGARLRARCAPASTPGRPRAPPVAGSASAHRRTGTGKAPGARRSPGPGTATCRAPRAGAVLRVPSFLGRRTLGDEADLAYPGTACDFEHVNDLLIVQLAVGGDQECLLRVLGQGVLQGDSELILADRPGIAAVARAQRERAVS